MHRVWRVIAWLNAITRSSSKCERIKHTFYRGALSHVDISIFCRSDLIATEISSELKGKEIRKSFSFQFLISYYASWILTFHDNVFNKILNEVSYLLSPCMWRRESGALVDGSLKCVRHIAGRRSIPLIIWRSPRNAFREGSGRQVRHLTMAHSWMWFNVVWPSNRI